MGRSVRPRKAAQALSINQIKILQSPVYRAFKDTPIVRKIRKKHRDSRLKGTETGQNVADRGKVADYRNLRNYYASLLKSMDMIHYNSTITKAVYEGYFQLTSSTVIGIIMEISKTAEKQKSFPRSS